MPTKKTPTPTPTPTPTLTAEITINDLMFNIKSGLSDIANFRQQKKEISIAEANNLLNMEVNFYYDVKNLAEINKKISNGGLQKHTLAVLTELKGDYAEAEESKEYKFLDKLEFFIKSNIPYFVRSRINKNNEVVYHSFKTADINLVMGNETLINAELKEVLKTEVSAYYVETAKQSLSDITSKQTKALLKAFNAVSTDINDKLKADCKKTFDKCLNIKTEIKTSEVEVLIQHLKNLKAEALKK